MNSKTNNTLITEHWMCYKLDSGRSQGKCEIYTDFESSKGLKSSSDEV